MATENWAKYFLCKCRQLTFLKTFAYPCVFSLICAVFYFCFFSYKNQWTNQFMFVSTILSNCLLKIQKLTMSAISVSLFLKCQCQTSSVSTGSKVPNQDQSLVIEKTKEWINLIFEHKDYFFNLSRVRWHRTAGSQKKIAFFDSIFNQLNPGQLD